MFLLAAMVTGSSVQVNQFVCGLTFHDFFRVLLQTIINSGWKARTADFVSQIIQAHEHAERYNIDLPYGRITSIAFVPDSNGCICIGEASDGTAICLWRGDGVPPSLAAFLGDVPPTNAVQSVSVGSGNGWVVVLQNGAIYSNGISEDLKQKLRSADSILVRVLPQIYQSGPFLIATLVRLTLAVQPR
jgi:hypothetical protein